MNPQKFLTVYKGSSNYFVRFFYANTVRIWVGGSFIASMLVQISKK